MSQELVSINGIITPASDARISVFDHCFLYGDGVFEGIRLINKKVLLHEEHLARLYRSAAIVRIKTPPREQYEKMFFDVIRQSDMTNGYIRVVISRGTGALGIDPRKPKEPTLVIIVSTLNLFPEDLYEKGLNVIVARTRKIPVSSFDCTAKSCNYLTNIMAQWEFIDRGAGEAIMTDADGIVSEGTVDNIFGIKGNKLFTPSVDMNCLEGTTRNKIMEIAKGQGMEVEAGRYTVHDFMFAEEAFLTGTGAGVIPIAKIEHQTIGIGSIGTKTRKLRGEYERRIEEFCTPIPH